MKRIKIMKRSFSKLFHIAWEEEKLYYLYVILNFICVGIYSYCIIQVPKVVLNMLEKQAIDLPELLLLFGGDISKWFDCIDM